MRTAQDHLRKHPRALPTTLQYIERRNAVVEQMRKELAAKPSRKSIIDRFMPWFWRRG
jgi:SOS response regulatory protein OraA/RecX